MNKTKHFAMSAYVIPSLVIIVIATSIWGTTNAQAGGAIHLKGFDAVLFDGDGNFVTVNCNQVRTPSNNGVMICHADVPNDAHEVVKYDATHNPFYDGVTPIPCEISAIPDTESDNIFTDDWTEIVSASGQATVICKLNH